jgi:hypothetical protein
MAALKVYAWHPNHVHDKRVENILAVPRAQTRYSAYVVAYTKADASFFARDARCGWPSQSELRVAQGAEHDALREAMLFESEGTVLVTSQRGGKKPVILCVPDDDDGSEGTGAQAIGTIRPADGHRGYVFEATTAKYAGRGSIAVGQEVAYVKRDVGYPEGVIWVGTDGADLVDHEMQRKLDDAELTIIRSGMYGFQADV